MARGRCCSGMTAAAAVARAAAVQSCAVLWLAQFGYVTLFAAAFPLGALFALVSNLLQARHRPGTGPASGCALKRTINRTEGQLSTRARPQAGCRERGGFRGDLWFRLCGFTNMHASDVYRNADPTRCNQAAHHQEEAPVRKSFDSCRMRRMRCASCHHSAVGLDGDSWHGGADRCAANNRIASRVVGRIR
jgi:hypothetical protein